ncbi:trihelix transcription factor GT-3b-like [Ananas comosus]|uniref:Trihelix transcription factor GT-3b-like n=1 Tax=Ananas comosus TaxID=4615 RepID=A0A6P5GJF2_ANACO|nr:trihelix transcription factor GT-3b-like [Ananas comosus]
MAHHLYPHLHFHGVDDASYYELNVVDVDPPLLQPPPPPLPPLPPPRPHEREAAASGVPQWSHAETAEFLAARAELDRSFAAAKRNKPLWEAVSARLRLKGFARTPDQCKSKWKNLLTRFKGSEAMEQESERQFPFYEEMRRIFSYRMERLLAFEKSSAKKKKKTKGKELEEELEEEEEKEEKKGAGAGAGAGAGVVEEVEGALRELMRRQAEMEERWMEAAEAREAERREKEGEWRRAMANLWEERLAMERRWRQHDEERRARAEARAERQHALVSALLAKFQGEGS